MPDVEKIIAEALDNFRLSEWADEQARTIEALAPAVAAALRDAGMLTETEWEYGAGYQADNGIEMRWFSMGSGAFSMGSGAFTIREAAEREVERFSDAQIRLVRRRKAGPWEPVQEGEV